MGNREEPTRQFQREAAMDDSISKSCAEAASKFADANPGIIVRGGGRKFISFDPAEDGLQHVSFTKKTRVSSGGMIKTLAYSVTRFEDDERLRERFQKLREAEAYFEEVVPAHGDRRDVSIGFPNYEAQSYEKQAEKLGLNMPSNL